MPGHVLDDDPWVGRVEGAAPEGLDGAADALGRFHQGLLGRDDRLRLGVFHTPMDIARPLVALALDELGRTPSRVFDPAVGGGALLIAAGDELVAKGGDPALVFGALGGGDVDPLAVRVADWTLRRWAWRHGLGWLPAADVEHRDAFAPDGRPPVDLLVTNPPFGGRLRRAELTGLPGDAAERFGEVLGPYADVATAFLLAADELVAQDGVAAVVLPGSVLSSRDAEAVRSRLSARRRLAAVWADPPGFDSVAIAPMGIVLGPHGGHTTVVTDGEVHRVADPGPRWSRAASIVPALDGLCDDGSIGDVAEVIAPFRDEYYGLVPAVVDGGEGPRLLTSGLIDPAVHRWGSRPARFAKRRFARPTVVTESAEPAARRWIARQAAPKVLVANQTRILEAVADPDGSLVGVTPVIAVVPHVLDVHDLLAVFLSPVASALLRRESVGNGLNPRALRVTAAALADLPLPAGAAQWRGAATLLAGAHGDGDATREVLPEVRRRMSLAYGLDPDGELAGWWERTTEA